MRSELAIALVLVACRGKADDSKAEPPAVARPNKTPNKTVESVTMLLPDGWKSQYEAADDKWLFTSPPLADGRTSGVIFERAPATSAASPEALRHYLETTIWDKGTTAEIEARQSNRDGFSTTFLVKPAADPAHPKRETYVMKEIYNDWFRCFSTWIVDDAMRDQVLALCKSLKTPHRL